MKDFLLQNNIQFEYVDITDGMGNLKRYLKLRDKAEEFKKVKAMGYLGVPCIVVDGKILTFGQPNLEDLK